MIVRKRMLVVALAGCLGMLVPVAASAQPTYEFNLPQQSLAEALRAVGRQTATDVLFDPRSVERLSAAPLRGRLSPEQAVGRMLAGTGLVAEKTAADSILIAPSRPASDGAKPLRLPAGNAAAAPAGAVLLAQAGRSVPAAALAQAGGRDPQPAAPATADEPTQLDTIVVSGAAQSGGLRKRDASFSITTATPEQISEAAPKSTADLLKIVPGVWAESAGGSTGANIDVRGFPGGSDAPFITVQLDGSPLFPPPTLSFLENSSLFRIDDTVERVEVLRGGPSPIFSNGQPGATINFIQKKGGDVAEGSARLTVGSGDLRRFDGYYGGPLGEDWRFSVGGFWRTTDGIRDTQYPADEGGQLSATLTRVFGNGELTLYGRTTDDRNAFFTAVPLISRDRGRDVDAFPGFDPRNDTLLGNDFRRVNLEVGPGQFIQRDLAEGRGADVDVFGAVLDLDFGGWRLNNRTNFLDGDAPTNGLFTGANPQTLAAFIADTIRTTGANPAVVRGSGTFFNGGGAVSPQQQVIRAGWWVVDKALRSFTNETRFSFDLNESNTLTAGAYYANYSSRDRWYLGNEMLLTAEPNARRIDVALNNGAAVTREGFVGAPFFALDADYDGENRAAFLAHEWEISPTLRLDAGLRYEQQEADALISNAVTVDLDRNPSTLYNNNASVLDGRYRRLSFDDDQVSWTAGLNWRLNDVASVFGRVNSGFFFPQFDNLRDGQDVTQQVDQYEVGLKSGNELFDLYLTAFYNEFEGLQFQVFSDINGDGIPDNVTSVGGSRAYGLEFEGAIRPFENFELALTGNWVDAKYRNFGNNSGNQVRRQPELQYRLTPSYYLPSTWGDLKFYLTYTYVGRRFSDPENAQRIPSYNTVDAGVAAYVGDRWEFRLSGSNLTNEIGLTEANPRVIGAATAGDVFLGRPIFGRAWELSVAYRF
ncbi:MAG TPA: TonB-dependent receptor [Pseudoxanthomonas sp.]|nr:TonB-dependent receptor [Pseudoxanthomonas sp.]